MGDVDTFGILGVPIPINEEERLAALRSYGILDTPPEPVFDRISSVAAAVFNAPIALVSLVDRERQWFKAAHGLDVQQTSRRGSFCAHAIVDVPVLVVPDAAKDPRFAENPLVIGEPYIRFYAGAPMVTSEGFRIGTLCVIDTVPRADSVGPKQVAILRDLAAVAVHQVEAGRQTTQETAELRRQLQQAGAAKQRFLQLMRHELRTPLNAIIGFSEVIKQRARMPLPAANETYANHIADAGRHLLSMIDVVLEWARVERGEVLLEEREVALQEPLETALALLPDGKDRLEVRTAPETVSLLCDPRFVAQILGNVIGNALRHCPDSTAIVLSTETVEDGGFSLRIADEGPGMRADQVEAAMQAFERLGEEVSRERPGLGLGLAISRKLMELHGGELRIKTAPGKGTTVDLVFPAYRSRQYVGTKA
ncbi:MAG: GAF domain-containing sensor histidine kinase [Kiloniellaceae bacterium]